MAGLTSVCIVCGGTDLSPLFAVDNVPAVVGALWPTAEAARGAVTGRLEMVVCRSCSHVSNRAFDTSLVDYDPGYENSLHFSPTFQRYALDLADRLVAAYGLHGKRLLEIGSGKGEFLKLLCEKGSNSGVGYDPTYDGESDSDDITFVRGLYPLDGTGDSFDFLSCRHVLEHLERPYEMLCGLRRSCAGTGVRLYFEVPNGEFTMSPSGQWDLIYPHISYFTPASLRRLVERSGFDVLECGLSFDDQFLYVEAAPGSPTSSTADEAAVAGSVWHAEKFASSYAATIAGWRGRLAGRDTGVASAALWGAGAKGTTFLNTVGRDSKVAAVVDVNPRKWGRFVPGTGHRVVAPADLADHVVDTVVITNSSYRQEIADQLAALGIGADIVCV